MPVPPHPAFPPPTLPHPPFPCRAAPPPHPTRLNTAPPLCSGGGPQQGQPPPGPFLGSGGVWGSMKTYLQPRVIITAIAIVFYVYPDLTDAFLALFSCQQVRLEFKKSRVI